MFGLVFLAEIVDSVSCAKCGAPLKIRAGEAVSVCEYCGSANTLKADKAFVISHSWMKNKLDEGETTRKAREWMGSGLIMPVGMGNAGITRKELIYVPIWVFRTRNKITYSGTFLRGAERKVSGEEEKELIWKTLGRRASSFPIREYRVPLEGKTNFSPEEAMEGKFLNAEIDEQGAREQAKQEIAEHMRLLLAEKVDRFDKCETRTDFKESEYFHAPVWEIDYNWKGRTYHIYIDGTRGEIIFGEIPAPDLVGFDFKIIAAFAVLLIIVTLCGFVALFVMK